MRHLSGGIAASTLLLAGCTTSESGMETAPTTSASAELLDASGQPMGRATAMQAGGDIRVRVEGTGLPPGSHGVHVHTVGQCTAPAFDSAGGHWNPTSKKHGRDNPDGMHKGDLPNLVVGTDGNGTLEFTVQGAMVRGGPTAMFDSDGASFVIHATADDYRTDPSGNSGGRIACGIFG